MTDMTAVVTVPPYYSSLTPSLPHNHSTPNHSTPSLPAGMAEVEMVKYLGYTPNYYDYRTERIECEACYSYNYTAWALWFLQPEVEAALGVCGDAGE
jgi:hypothetical protein